MTRLLPALVFFIFSSCIPLRIAPKIKEDKVMVAKKFKRNLPRDYALIFKDPKEADEFYDYINIKFELDHQNVGNNVPFTIDNEEFFLSFYETEIPTKTINIIPVMIDASLVSKGHDPMFEGAQFSRIGIWYLVLTVSNANMDDCLNPDHKSQKKAIKYLRDLRMEYLNTHNYLEVLLRK